MSKNNNNKVQISRRLLLKKLGAICSAVALSEACPFQSLKANKILSSKTKILDKRQQIQPFYGFHQSGILTPQQALTILVAFNVLASNKKELKRLFQILTDRFAFLTKGGIAPEIINPQLPSMDSGILGANIFPDNLTMTLSVGASLFDNRFGLAHHKPKQLQNMIRFPNDALDANLCHGDILIQICANTQDTLIHALRDIIKYTPDLLAIRWQRDGFIANHSTTCSNSNIRETPINLLGFKDGTANPEIQNTELMNRLLWITSNQKKTEPTWMIGGTYQVIRIIRFYVEKWDRTPIKEQQTIFGREKLSGAPLGMKNEHDIPDYNRDPNGLLIPLNSHIRLANPRTTETTNNLILRRGYNYSSGITKSGQLDMGLLFICYQHDLIKGFISMQNRLNGEALEEYITPIGGGYFFALPGVRDKNHYLGQLLLQNS
ncbi:iron uptake transporter deferrochelatase/peroxidase subunit [Pantoea sp. Aalb]|uniref:iron uptake transporter deferrochelatase/peroxidase subunit n=1 Tax=Pantoea sp. Aalb TaxID=2576762 RepID=UPI0013242B48|nr:iron uptake transporter deferrochelatase/peroxidase subunit [Pantoea sp. Aalb]MXP67345.1 deferrochelatase/peroxidase EfeB [Pantoea sp. Aalb]